MHRAWDIELIFPIKDAASAALMLVKANCLDKAGIISEAEKQWVHSRARTFLADAPLDNVARFKRIALAQFLVAGCVVAFSVCGLIEPAQAQATYVPPPPTQSPTLNPSNPGTVPQPSYTPLTPSTPSTAPTTPSAYPSTEVPPPANEANRSTTAESEPTRTVHHHYRHHRGYYAGAGPSLGSFDCSYFSWCVRTSPPSYYRQYGWYRY